MNKYFVYFILLLLTKYLHFFFFERKLEFSGAVFTLFLLILIDKRVNFWKLAGVFTLIFFIDVFILNWVFLGLSVKEAYNLAFPAAYYYYAFLFICIIVDISRLNHEKKMLSLLAIDLVCNLLELVVKESFSYPFIKYVVIGITVRGVMVYLIFLAYKKKEFIVLQEEHQKKYLKLNLMASNLEAESFYLKKMSSNVESLMKKSYDSYQNVATVEEARGYFLDLSREIHELKKDYTRVIAGLDNLFNKFEQEETLGLSKIGEIIKSNTNRYLIEHKLDISIEVKFRDAFKVKYYHKIFIIINNLIINSIESLSETSGGRPGIGEIKISQYSDRNFIYISVSDNGPGIPEPFIDLIFNPGFTTKFDKKTGDSSTGMGLSHVKNTIDEMGGSMEIISSPENGTSFKIQLPIGRFRGDADEKKNSYN